MYFSDNIRKEPCFQEHKYIMWLWTDQLGVNGRFSLPPNLIGLFRGEGGEEKRDAG